MTISKPQYLIDLERDGYVVVPNVVPQDMCEEFQEAALTWTEKFPFGFKRDDRSTWDSEHLPFSTTGGLYNRYAVNHEDFVWKIRAYPGVRKVFEEIWETDDLITSFDGMNVSLPINEKTGRTDIKTTPAWPHIDQNPRVVEQFLLYQGIVNLAPNGPEDGGLCVLKGSQALHKQHFDAIGGFRPEMDLGEKENSYRYTPEDFAWYTENGCEVVKVCANPGDLILWDSRTIHWNCSPVGNQTRFATYVCMCPRSKMTEKELARKREIFETFQGTTHWPYMNIIPVNRGPAARAKRPDGTDDVQDTGKPFNPPVVTPEVLRLVGIRA